MISGLAACGGAEDRKAKYFERGKELFEQGNYVKSELEFKNVLQIDPKQAEARNQQVAIRSHDAREGIRAFREKRSPVWRGL